MMRKWLASHQSMNFRLRLLAHLVVLECPVEVVPPPEVLVEPGVVAVEQLEVARQRRRRLELGRVDEGVGRRDG